MITTERDQARFWSKIALPNEQGCMLWMAYLNPRGYGLFWLPGRMHPAHRIAYALAYGEVPEGLVIDHLCRVRHCMAPDHLEAVTSAENTRRGTSPSVLNSHKTHCPQGHPYAGENLYSYPSGKGRRCRTCARERRGCISGLGRNEINTEMKEAA